jgi:N-acetylmuramoyl-L-alanine amidase
MSKIIDNFLIPLFLILSSLYAFNSLSNDRIELNKVYHHIAADPNYLERANISLYFSHDPHVQVVQLPKSHGSDFSFFFPGASVASGECQAMIDRVNNQKYNGYSISITNVIKPTRGIMLTFKIDQNQCSLAYENFDSIGLQKGLVFRLYNKNVLARIEEQNDKPILRTLWHSPRIIIDPGHGGSDGGAMSKSGTQEKQVCLAIGTAVSSLLEEKGCSVVMTRNNDCDVRLDERTLYAHENKGDVFVSIHANHAGNPKSRGIETFCMQPSLLKKGYSQLSQEQDRCVADVMAQRASMSLSLAQSVQKNICASVALLHDEPIDRKVKFSVSQVLLGVQMPAILIEVGFLSHLKEAALLQNQDYQNRIAHGISDGILQALSF